MFDFIFQKRSGELVSLLDILQADTNRLAVSALAYAKSVSMIAQAIAKAEVLIQSEKGFIEDSEDYYRWNVAPNENEEAYDFWYRLAVKLLTEQEAVIVPLKGQFFLADSWVVNQNITAPKRYTNIVISCGSDTMTLSKAYKADELIHLRYPDNGIHIYIKTLLREFDKAIDTANQALTLSNSPKFIYRIKGTVAIRPDAKTGNAQADQITAKRAMAKSMLDALKEAKVGLLTLGDGYELSQLKIDSSVSPETLKNLISQAEAEASKAFNIPLACYSGSITEKADSTNEFITYAVSPLAKVITDGLNSRVIGKEDYMKGERMTLWLGNFQHRDLIDSAGGMDKLRGIGFSFDEIRKAVGFTPLHTEFSEARALTKNYSINEKETT